MVLCGHAVNRETKSSAKVPYTSSVRMMRSGRCSATRRVILAEPVVADLDRGRIAGIDQEECLDLRVQQLVDLAIGILPSVLLIRLEQDLDELIIAELGDLDVRGKDRHAEGDGITRRNQPIFAQRVEDVGDRGGAAFGREQVDACPRSAALPSSP